MGFLLLIAFSIYGLGCMCDFPECDRKKNTPDRDPASEDPRCNENPEPNSCAGRPASDRPPVRPGTLSRRMYRRAPDEDKDDAKVSIDELEYMRRFFH